VCVTKSVRLGDLCKIIELNGCYRFFGSYIEGERNVLAFSELMTVMDMLHPAKCFFFCGRLAAGVTVVLPDDG